MRNDPITLDMAKQGLESAKENTISKIEEFGDIALKLYESVNSIQDIFDSIRGIPDDKRLQYQTLLKKREAWKAQAEDILHNAKAGTQNANPGMNGFDIGASAVSVSSGLASGLATCMESMSFGILAPALGGIPSLAVATAIGSAPIVDPLSLLVMGTVWAKLKADKECINNICIRVCNRDIRAYYRANVEIDERIKRIEYEKARLDRGIEFISSFGTDYSVMNNDQQYALGTYLNLMLSATQLIINPIDGLKPFYSDEDFESYVYSWDEFNEKLEVVIQKKRKEGKKTRRYESYIEAKILICLGNHSIPTRHF